MQSDPGPLAGDPIASYFKTQLSSILNASIPGFDNEEIYMAYFGLETQRDGSLIVNKIRLMIILTLTHPIFQLFLIAWFLLNQP